MKKVCAKHLGTFKSCNPSCIKGWNEKQTVIRRKIVDLLNEANVQLGVHPLGLKITSMIDQLEAK